MLQRLLSDAQEGPSRQKPGRAAPQDLSFSALAQTMAGKRFALFGFSKEEDVRLTRVIERYQAFSRTVSRPIAGPGDNPVIRRDSRQCNDWPRCSATVERFFPAHRAGNRPQRFSRGSRRHAGVPDFAMDRTGIGIAIVSRTSEHIPRDFSRWLARIVENAVCW